jgi:uncharacterized protein (DUF362 family)
MNRRNFCRKMASAGGALVLSPLIESCTRAEPPTPQPSPVAANTAQPTTPPTPPHHPTATPVASTQTGDTARIALVKTQDRAEGIRRAIDLLGTNPVSGNRVLFKPNFNSADEAPGSTHPDVLREMLTRLTDMGAQSITIADRSGMGNTRAVMNRKGVFDLADEFGIEAVVFDELADTDWVMQQSGDFHWSQGFPVPRLLLDTECVVQTCNLKTHRFGGHFTLSLKNSVGFVADKLDGHNYMGELHSGDTQRKMIAEINTAYTPSLIVMDGVEAFLDGGPDTGTRAETNVVLAGTDRIAIDAVGVAILRLFGTTPEVSQGKIFDLDQIARAVELGLGIESPDKIELITADTDTDSQAYADQIRPILLA